MTSKKIIRRYLFAGLVVWVPILITFAIVRFIVDLLDQTLSFIPHAYQPTQLLGVNIPGFGILLSLLLLLLTGLLVTNYLGERIIAWGEAILAKIPLIRTIYMGAKQVIQALFGSNSQAFRKVLLIEYPRKGSWTMAFLTGNANHEINSQTGVEMLCVYVPTTPNPTSGFLLFIPKEEAYELSMSIDEAIKFIISLGVTTAQVTIIPEPQLNHPSH